MSIHMKHLILSIEIVRQMANLLALQQHLIAKLLLLNATNVSRQLLDNKPVPQINRPVMNLDRYILKRRHINMMNGEMRVCTAKRSLAAVICSRPMPPFQAHWGVPQRAIRSHKDGAAEVRQHLLSFLPANQTLSSKIPIKLISAIVAETAISISFLDASRL